MTRDPRDIYLSDLKLKSKGFARGTTNFPFKGYLFKPLLVLYTILEWRNSLKIYFKIQEKFGEDKIQLFKYEDLITNQNSVINRIATFLGVESTEFSPNKISIIDSSYKERKVNRWKTSLGMVSASIIKLFTIKYLKKLGYSL